MNRTPHPLRPQTAGFDVQVVDGRIIFQGVDVDDILDNNARSYTQSSDVNRITSIRLAFRAGQLAAIAEMKRTGESG
jgi:hypothetical protein